MVTVKVPGYSGFGYNRFQALLEKSYFYNAFLKQLENKHSSYVIQDNFKIKKLSFFLENFEFFKKPFQRNRVGKKMFVYRL